MPNPAEPHPVRSGRRARTWAAALATVTLVVGTPALLPVAASAATAPVGLAVVAARPAIPGGATRVGSVPATRTVTGAVSLEPRDPSALSAFATAVSTPGSREYHDYLPAGRFASTFGPTTTAIDAVEAQLRADGIHVSSVSGNGLLVNFTAPAAAAERAFHTGLEDYRLTGGRVASAQTTAIELPTTIAGYVAGVVGLDTLAAPESAGVLHGATGHAKAAVPAVTTSTAKAAATSGGPSACADATGAATEFGGLTDQQIAASYGVDGLYTAGDTGAGQSVAVFELEPYNRSDIAAFDTCYFGSTRATSMLSRLTTTTVDGGQQTGYGSGEAELDIDDVSGVAPGASIDVYEAPNTTYGSLDEYDTIVSRDAQKVITSSWGECEYNEQQLEPGVQQLENTIFEQAAAQGQSVFAAAGDDGDDSCAYHSSSPIKPYLSALDPASQPYVTGVGGLTITDATNPPVENVWNDGANFGAGGGGLSSTWAEPSWQAADTVPGLNDPTVIADAEKVSGSDFCGASQCREVPDVSAQADEFTGAVTIYFEGAWSTIGGTSSATPLWAAMLTDIDASKACSATGGVGFANPALYAVASSPSQYAASFTNVTSGNNDLYELPDSLYPATTGYSMAAGLGSPRVTDSAGSGGLDADLCAVGGAAGTPKVTAVSPSVVNLDGANATASSPEFAVTGSGWTVATGADAVASVAVGAYVVPSADVTVASATTIDVTGVTAADLTGAAGADPSNDVPDGNGTYDVSVTLDDGHSAVTASSEGLTFVDGSATSATPDVSAVAASGGPSTGGTPVRIYGSGFTPTDDTVAFGGVDATSVSYVSADELTAVAPATTGGTACAVSGETTAELCQVEVVVTDAGGSSPTRTILPGLSGTLDFNAEGILVPSATCKCEVSPAPTEFDYLPTPTISSITLSPTSEASEAGGTVATINGTGFAYLGLDWIDVGPPSSDLSPDYSLTSVTPTRIKVALPAEKETTGTLAEKVSVQTVASPNLPPGPGLASTTPPSNVVDVTYGPTPTLTSITTPATRYLTGPDTGKTTIDIAGSGFAHGDTVEFVDAENPYGASDTETKNFSVKDDGAEILMESPPDNPGVDIVEVCSTVAETCSATGAADDTFTYYAPGNPSLSKISTHTGKAGTKVTITGSNLGYIRGVYFGKVKAKVFANAPGILDSGSTTTITATVPAGTAGAKVFVDVQTLESIRTGYDGTTRSKENPAVYFTYAK